MVKKNGQALVTFEMLTEFYHEMIKPQFDKLNEKFDFLDAKFDTSISGLQKDVKEIKTDIRYIKDDIKGIKADLSVTVTRKEFNELKEEVKDFSAS